MMILLTGLMPPPEYPLAFIRSIKGAPASVLLALLFARRRMTDRELQHLTGYSEQSVARALHLLADLGWLTALSPRGRWSLNPSHPLLKPHAGARGPHNDDDRKEDANVVRSLHALYDAGIQEPTAGRLAHLPHVNPAYIAAHVQRAASEGFALGTAIYRIDHAWPVPMRKPPLSVEERIRRFIAGE